MAPPVSIVSMVCISLETQLPTYFVQLLTMPAGPMEQAAPPPAGRELNDAEWRAEQVAAAAELRGAHPELLAKAVALLRHDAGRGEEEAGALAAELAAAGREVPALDALVHASLERRRLQEAEGAKQEAAEDEVGQAEALTRRTLQSGTADAVAEKGWEETAESLEAVSGAQGGVRAEVAAPRQQETPIDGVLSRSSAVGL